MQKGCLKRGSPFQWIREYRRHSPRRRGINAVRRTLNKGLKGEDTGMKSMLLIFLALMMLFGVAAAGAAEAPSVNTEEAVSEEPVEALYRDDNVTVTLDYLQTEGSTVKAGFRVSCPEKRSCILLPNVSKDLMEEEVFTALRKMKAIGGGTISYRCRPEESILCEYVWDLEDNWDFSVLSLFPSENPITDLACVTVPLETGSFPKAAGFTLVETNGDTDIDQYIFLNEGINQEELRSVILGTVSLQFTAKE